MRCEYCFYHDVAEKPRRGLLRSNVKADAGECGENGNGTCRGRVRFYVPRRRANACGAGFFSAKRCACKKNITAKVCRCLTSIQTNGYCIDREWAQFLAKENFLVGLSLDGMKEIHDGFRVDAQGKAHFLR